MTGRVNRAKRTRWDVLLESHWHNVCGFFLSLVLLSSCFSSSPHVSHLCLETLQSELPLNTSGLSHLGHPVEYLSWPIKCATVWMCSEYAKKEVPSCCLLLFASQRLLQVATSIDWLRDSNSRVLTISLSFSSEVATKGKRGVYGQDQILVTVLWWVFLS